MLINIFCMKFSWYEIVEIINLSILIIIIMRARSSTAPFLEMTDGSCDQLTPRSRRSATFSMASSKHFFEVSDYSMDSSTE
jgi:energy-coupling factor transporter transmembrane protein EcfT